MQQPTSNEFLLNEFPAIVVASSGPDPRVLMLVTVDMMDAPVVQLTTLTECPHVIGGGHYNKDHDV